MEQYMILFAGLMIGFFVGQLVPGPIWDTRKQSEAKGRKSELDIKLLEAKLFEVKLKVRQLEIEQFRRPGS